MICADCKIKTKVDSTAKSKYVLEVYRRRACPNCGKVFYTREVIDQTAREDYQAIRVAARA